MGIYLCVNIGIALLLFYVDGKIGLILSNHRDFFSYNPYLFGDNGKEKRSNYTLCVLSPAVSIAIFAVAYEHIGFDSGIDSLWMICPLYWGVRFVYFALRNRLAFLDLKYEGVRFVLSILITTAVFYVICKLRKNEQSLFISWDEIRNAVWYALLAYIAKLVWDMFQAEFCRQNEKNADRVREITIRRYNEFSEKFCCVVNCCISEESTLIEFYSALESTIYAIMIYEDYNRPILVRELETFLMRYHLNRGCMMTLGVMQTRTNRVISDEESIRLAIQKIVPIIESRSISSEVLLGECGSVEMYFGEKILPEILKDYNGTVSYLNEVTNIYNMIEQYKHKTIAKFDTTILP